ncbi:trigger factor [Ehrlichia chaffeensis str. Heartland]|uniref:Trigger factor n=1 Tax=Ehrlichia chaffeensis (strain ATCC CRL-10679 / Arkansas) TaxID=205920 RepID=TIG_EHRCR|nr:trigger factor [Ehrlichia chaffeensis]Q2GFT7.1 RecName: Full=Trigger factor; Short=TF; AltName: Full=PPIase [Ehrlichia chaffeensis str. Arkansas]ABD44540.1 trigger factor [Ehrlichia chaffeensis str. Arkansas]AHX03943.1 trigger factor [Ehrlichia chaffeensis str. Heartland]AHX05326.1 trigger factor [Ehrlichia chaffeensis str. Jax]AHX06313.1 trigger factor [Ehrlichia chaffeensis str. Liberty]AHX07397.1 trigger factor [Ehrlichia chaffeensis str. Osceola]
MLNSYVVREVSNDKLKWEYEFAVDKKYFLDQLDSKLSEIAMNVKVPGFRVGKASIDLVRKEYLNEAMTSVVKKTIESTSSDFVKNSKFGEIISSNIDIVSYPSYYSDNDKEEDLVYKLSFEVMPEAPLMDIDNIVLSDIEVDIQECDVNEFIENLKKQRPDFVIVDDPEYVIQGSDKLVIDYQNKIKGKILRGGSAKDFVLVLGKGVALREFEDQLIGMKVGESKTFPLTFPNDYGMVHLAGKTTDMSVTVKSVYVMKGMRDSEAIAKDYGFKDVGHMEDFARKRIKQQFDQMVFTIVKKELFDYMDANYVIDVPECVVTQEIAKINKEIRDSGEDIQIDVEKEAIKRVKLGMLLIKMSRHNNITIKNEDVFSFIQSNYADYGVDIGNVLKMLQSNKNFANYISGKVLEEKVINYIIGLAKKDKKVMTAKDISLMFENI